MLINQFLAIVAIFLILINLWFVSNIPTHIAYLLMTYTIVNLLELPLYYQIALGFFVWLAFVAFHVKVWRKVIEKVNKKSLSYKIQNN